MLNNCSKFVSEIFIVITINSPCGEDGEENFGYITLLIIFLQELQSLSAEEWW